MIHTVSELINNWDRIAIGDVVDKLRVRGKYYYGALILYKDQINLLVKAGLYYVVYSRMSVVFYLNRYRKDADGRVLNRTCYNDPAKLPSYMIKALGLNKKEEPGRLIGQTNAI